MQIYKKISFILTGCLLLAGCESTQETILTNTCPRTMIVQDFARQSFTNDDGTKVLAELHMEDIRPRCQPTDHKTLRIQVYPGIAAFRRVSDQFDEIESNYFIALQDKRTKKFIAKEDYRFVMEFDKGERLAQRRVDVHRNAEFEIPIDSTLDDYVVYAGLQVSEEQVKANRYRTLARR